MATTIEAPRERLLAGLPVTERRLSRSGISTAVVEGGDGPPMVLLHGPAGNATHWARVLGDLVATHHVIAPDLPGHGATTVDGELDADRVLAWLGALIDETCASPPVLVGYALGGAIAARFAMRGELSRLVLVDALGLAPFEPDPAFGRALHAFLGEPDGQTHEGLWRRCAHDLDGLRGRMGDRWDAFEAYNLDRARTPSVMAALGSLMRDFGTTAIPLGGAGADRRPHHADLGASRPRDAAARRRGAERAPRLAAARDRGLGRRPADRAARRVRDRAARSRRRGRRPRAPRL